MTLITFETPTLTIAPWPDTPAPRMSFDPRSPYVERFWLGVIGPSATWLLRRVASGFDAEPGGFEMPLGETALALGLGDRSGRNSPFFRTLNRLVQFELARMEGPSRMQVVRRLPPLQRRHVQRLSPAMRDAHEAWLIEARNEPPGEEARRRCRQLALSLFELGEDEEEVERQLLRWRYHPALARESAVWARARHQQALVAAGQPAPGGA